MGVDWKEQSHEENESVALWGKEILKSNTEDILPRQKKKTSLENQVNGSVNNRSERKEGRERWKKGRKGMGSALQRNIMHVSVRRKRALKNPSVCGKAPSAGEHSVYPAAEKSLEQMVQCRAGEWEEKLMTKALL